VAETAPEVEEPGPDDQWRILLSQTSVAVRTDGTLSVERILAGQALRYGVSGFTVGGFHFDDSTRIRSARSWHLPPGGNVRRNRGRPIDFTFDDSFVTDQRTRIVPVGRTEQGSLVFIEFDAVEDPETLTFVHSFYEAAPVDRARYEIEVPPGWKVRHDWPRTREVAPEVDGHRWVWELENLDGPSEPEPLGEAAFEGAPFLVVTVVPPAGTQPEKATVAPDWRALADWFSRLMEGRDTLTPEIEAAAAALPRFENDPLGEIRAAALYVRDGIRYVAREIGIGGWQPRPASQVIHEKLGDCKDKGILLRALLRARGFDAHPILIDAVRKGTVSFEVPAQHSFTHLVVGVVLPREVELPPGFEAATLDTHGPERLLVIDTTDELISIGWLPAHLAGRRGLLVAGESSRLIEIPDGDAAAHRVERDVLYTISDGGEVQVQRSISRFGEPAGEARARWRTSAGDYRRDAERGLRSRWPGAAIDSVDVEQETRSGAFVETIRCRRPCSTTGPLLSLFPDVLDDLARVPLGDREQAVAYPYALTLRCSTSVRGVPDGAALPTAHADTGDGWRVTTRFSREGGDLSGTFELQLVRRRFEPDAFEQLRAFWNAARQAASVAVRLDPPDAGP
jgi:transglutaminase-like putative cysteine protease